MANIASAKKALRGSLKKRVFNLRHKKAVHDTVKSVREFVSNNKIDEAKAELSKAYKALDKAAKHGVIKKNNASRKKSRLASALKKISQ
jgi:small subunit ribosomal protein S20